MIWARPPLLSGPLQFYNTWFGNSCIKSDSLIRPPASSLQVPQYHLSSFYVVKQDPFYHKQKNTDGIVYPMWDFFHRAMLKNRHDLNNKLFCMI